MNQWCCTDDLIKTRSQRRSERNNPKPTNQDRALGRSKANRQAKINARRGLRSDSKATNMEIEKEAHKQAKRSAILDPRRAQQQKKSSAPQKLARPARRVGEAKMKAKRDQKKKQDQQQQKKKQNQQNNNNNNNSNSKNNIDLLLDAALNGVLPEAVPLIESLPVEERLPLESWLVVGADGETLELSRRKKMTL